MTDRPTRATVAGRKYLDLQNLARRTKRPTDELHQIYALEGFLARLIESDYADRLVLKGGVLLAALDVRRPTRDVDFQGRHVSNDVDQMLGMVKVIASIPLDHGLVLHSDAAVAEIIRDQDEYSGVRVTLTGQSQRRWSLWLRKQQLTGPGGVPARSARRRRAPEHGPRCRARTATNARTSLGWGLWRLWRFWHGGL